MSHLDPICVHPANPHYYLWKNKPTILITSAEHYGAVVNGDFDYTAYLDALASYGLNYTRIYPGYLFEPKDKFIVGNSLAPRPEALILPWARSAEPGYILGGNKYDLSAWDEAYFQRLTAFLACAEARGIVVEICFFNCQYPDTWPLSPLYHTNNIQGVGQCDHIGAQTLDADPALVRYEAAYVEAITRAANPYGNVILEVCDEVNVLGTPLAKGGPWIAHMVQTIRETERALPNRHLVAQQVTGPLGGPCDFSADPEVDIIVGQYVWETTDEQEGGIKALDFEYEHDKPIELNETNYYPVWYQGDRVASSRAEAWEFIVGGGASFNHLNGLFTAHDPAGATEENAEICGALRNLAAFMDGFNFVAMRQDRTMRLVGGPPNTLCRGLSEPGKQYALYLHHSTGERSMGYIVQPGRYVETIALPLPPGDYHAEWIEPATGRVISASALAHDGGECALTTPVHAIDIALRLRRML